jgi:hypothetical protein
VRRQRDAAYAVIDLLFPVALVIIAILYSAVGQAGGTGYIALIGTGWFRTSDHQAHRTVLQHIGFGHWLRPVLSFGFAHVAKCLPVRRSWPALLIAGRHASSLRVRSSTSSRRIAADRRCNVIDGDRLTAPKRFENNFINSHVFPAWLRPGSAENHRGSTTRQERRFHSERSPDLGRIISSSRF